MMVYLNGLVQDCSNSSALAMELLQSCIKTSIYQRYTLKWSVFAKLHQHITESSAFAEVSYLMADVETIFLL